MNPTVKPKFTAGLHVSEPSFPANGAILIHDSSSNDVAEVFHVEYSTVPMAYADALALAHKMAASQEIYEALDALMGGDEKLQVGIGGNPHYVEDFIAKARAALSKARGEQP